MPTTKAPQELPEAAQKIWVSTFNAAFTSTCKEQSDPDACAAKIAWTAVKRKYQRTSEGKWQPKSLATFDLFINKAWHDKSARNYRWNAVGSDTEKDLRGDNMSLELFQSFMDRIHTKELPPEQFRSGFWKGGLPYLSISHYSDQSGAGVPGDIETVYVDGNRLKGKGTLFDNPLGQACFEAIRNSKDSERPVKISIAFLDYKHRHKSNGVIFERQTPDDICPQCITEFLSNDRQGVQFLDGHLIHWAFTKVPVNERTPLEVEMVTQKDDATEIIGEELAEELDKREKKKPEARALMMNAETVATPPVLSLEAIKSLAEEVAQEVMTVLTPKLSAKSTPEHPLDGAFSQLKSQYDIVVSKTMTGQQKLQEIQEAFDRFGHVLIESVTPQEKSQTSVDSGVNQLADAIAALTDQVAIMQQEVRSMKTPATSSTIPERRGLLAPPVQAPPTVKLSKLSQAINRTTGLDAHHVRPGAVQAG